MVFPFSSARFVTCKTRRVLAYIVAYARSTQRGNKRCRGERDDGGDRARGEGGGGRKGARRRDGAALRMASEGEFRKKERKKEGNYAVRRAAPAHSIA